MRSADPGRARHSIADWLQEPEEGRLELIDGELLEKAAPDAAHGFAQTVLVGELSPRFNRKGADGLGGWWLATEVDIALNGDGFRPDILGWRRDRVPQIPKDRPVTIRPDWVCEIVSAANAARDTVLKLKRYHRAQVPHYWLLDPRAETLTVYRYQVDGYLLVVGATRGDVVRAEPFGELELRVGLLFGDDPAD